MSVKTNEKVRWIYISSFIDLFAVSLILPAMSAHLKSLGASHLVIGGMTSIYACMQLISGPIIGSCSDKIGRQKIFIVAGIIISCCYVVLGLINSLWMIFFVRATIGIFKHHQMLLRMIVIDRIPVDQQTYIFGQLKSIAGVSFTLGPAIGGHLTEFDRGFCYICFSTGMLLSINIVIGYLYFDDIKNREIQKRKLLKENMVDAVYSLIHINWFTFWQIFALKLIHDMSAGLFSFNYGLRLSNRFNISLKVSGYTIAFQNFISVIAGIFVGSLNEKFYKDDVNYKRRAIHGFICLSIAYIGILFANYLGIFLLWTGVLTSTRMFLRIILSDMLMRKCLPSQTGSVAGLNNSVSNLARLITPLTAGFMEDMWGANCTDFLASAIAITGAVISLKITGLHHEKNV